MSNRLAAKHNPIIAQFSEVVCKQLPLFATNMARRKNAENKGIISIFAHIYTSMHIINQYFIEILEH